MKRIPENVGDCREIAREAERRLEKLGLKGLTVEFRFQGLRHFAAALFTVRYRPDPDRLSNCLLFVAYYEGMRTAQILKDLLFTAKYIHKHWVPTPLA